MLVTFPGKVKREYRVCKTTEPKVFGWTLI